MHINRVTFSDDEDKRAILHRICEKSDFVKR